MTQSPSQTRIPLPRAPSASTISYEKPEEELLSSSILKILIFLSTFRTKSYKSSVLAIIISMFTFLFRFFLWTWHFWSQIEIFIKNKSNFFRKMSKKSIRDNERFRYFEASSKLWWQFYSIYSLFNHLLWREFIISAEAPRQVSDSHSVWIIGFGCPSSSSYSKIKSN